MLSKAFALMLFLMMLAMLHTALYNAYMDYNGYVNTFTVDNLKCVTSFKWFTSTTGCAITE